MKRERSEIVGQRNTIYKQSSALSHEIATLVETILFFITFNNGLLQSDCPRDKMHEECLKNN